MHDIAAYYRWGDDKYTGYLRYVTPCNHNNNPSYHYCVLLTPYIRTKSELHFFI